MHHFYHIAGVTDLSVMRDQANVRTRPNNKFNPEPDDSIIHLHKHEVECTKYRLEHEFYPVPPRAPHDLFKEYWGDDK